jgi:hypothetical protein
LAFLGCLLLITTGMGIRSTFAYAQQQEEDPNSLGVTYSKGYDAGKLTAASTYKIEGAHNSICPAGHPFTYRIIYHAGYGWKWQLQISSWQLQLNSTTQ